MHEEILFVEVSEQKIEDKRSHEANTAGDGKCDDEVGIVERIGGRHGDCGRDGSHKERDC